MADLRSLIPSAELEARPEVSEVSEDFNDFNLLTPFEPVSCGHKSHPLC